MEQTERRSELGGVGVNQVDLPESAERVSIEAGVGGVLGEVLVRGVEHREGPIQVFQGPK